MLPELTIRAAQAECCRLTDRDGCRPFTFASEALGRLFIEREAREQHFADLLFWILAAAGPEGIDAAAALAARLAAARQESEAQGPLLFDGHPSDDPQRAPELRKDLSTPENREYWRFIAETAAEVATWPDWKRGAAPRDNPAADLERADAEEPVPSPEERRARVYALAGKYRDALPSVDEFLAEKHSCALRCALANADDEPGVCYALRQRSESGVPHGTPPGRLPAAPLADEDERDHRTVWERTQSAAAPAVWVAPAAGADLTPTAGMELEREIADAAESERREGLR